MTQKYSALPHSSLGPHVRHCRPPHHPEAKVSPDAPALEVMTDLERVRAVSIPAHAGIDAANQHMMVNGVRLLLVLDDDEYIIGLLTASDVMGERPIQHLQRFGGTFTDIRVADIMTPWERLEVLEYEDVARARVGDIVETLTTAARQHALVVERRAGGDAVRGIFSATQIGRQLGIGIVPACKAQTFAELEAALV